MTKPLPEYLADVKKNYNQIDVLILGRGKDPANALAQLQQARASTKDPVDQVLLDYLIARSHYWAAFNEFKASRQQTVFAAHRPQVIDGYLRAFAEADALPDKSGKAGEMRQMVVKSFVAVLATEVWGRSLSVEERERVIKEFVERAEAAPDHATLLPPSRALKDMYVALKLEDHMERIAPAQLPNDFSALRKLLVENSKALRDADRQRVVEKLVQDFRPSVEKDPQAAVAIGSYYVGKGEPGNARPWYEAAYKASAEYALPLVRFALRPESGVSDEQIRAAMDGCLAKMPPQGPDPESSDGSREQYYQALVVALSSAQRHAWCVELAERYEKDPCIHTDTPGMEIQYLKARSLDTLGQSAAAIKAYDTYVTRWSMYPVVFGRRDEIRKRITELQKPAPER